MRPFLLISIALLLSACGQPDAGEQVATPQPATAMAYPVAISPPYPIAKIQSFLRKTFHIYPAPQQGFNPYPAPLSTAQIAQLQVTNLPPCPEPTATPVAGIDPPLPTWTPAPPGTLPPTPFPTPSPAPFPGDFVLTLVASPAQGTAPLSVTLSATLTGGPDDRYELYCPSPEWVFGDGQGVMTFVDCVGWSPDARVQRVFTTEYRYEHAGTYEARLRISGQAGVLESNMVTVEVR